jgi:excisionase family DNA binding protein
MSVEQTNTTGEALLRLPDAAKYLGISKDRLRGMIRGDNGVTIACYKLSPRDIRFSKRDLDAWLESCRLS